MSVKNYPECTSLDHIKPSLRKKPDEIIIHATTNDITTEINMLANVKKIVKLIRDETPETEITFSGLIIRNDRPTLIEKVKTLNEKLRNYCEQQSIGLMDNSNIDETCLGMKKLHLNKKGNGVIARNFLNYTDK